MENLRIKVLCWRCWPLLLVSIQQFSQTCCTQSSNPCEGFADTKRLSYGISNFIECNLQPNHMQGQPSSYHWFQNGTQLDEGQDPNLGFNSDEVLDLDFVDSNREGYYDCSYVPTSSSSRVNGTPAPKCIIVRGVPEFENKTDLPILFYVDEELDIPVVVKYVGAGAYGAVFEVVGVSIARFSSGMLISCQTPLLPVNIEANFTCNSDPVEPIVGSVTTDRRTYVNASFIINPASANDTGEYTVRITAQDTQDTTITTLTMTLSASATVRPEISTSSIDTQSMSRGSSVMTLTPTASVVQPTPTSSIMDGSPTSTTDTGSIGKQEKIILSVSIVAGVVILALLLGIVAICLLILHGMCPKLKKQIMGNVRLLKIKQNGRDDIITVMTEGTTTQNAKRYYQPEYVELTPEKNSIPSNV